MSKWWHRQRAEREQLDVLIRATPPVESSEKKSVGLAEERAEARATNERTALEENAKALNGMTFTTVGWTWGVIEYQGAAAAKIALDAVNVALDPEKPGDDGAVKRGMPIFVHSVGAETDEHPLPVVGQIGSKITKMKNPPRRA